MRDSWPASATQRWSSLDCMGKTEKKEENISKKTYLLRNCPKPAAFLQLLWVPLPPRTAIPHLAHTSTVSHTGTHLHCASLLGGLLRGHLQTFSPCCCRGSSLLISGKFPETAVAHDSSLNGPNVTCGKTERAARAQNKKLTRTTQATVIT